ncbi:GntR family transcriptional regulator [Mycolicibacterium sp. CBM1]
MSEPMPAPLSLGEAAHQRIRADIVSCRLPPGQRLTERGLAAELGLGISPVRDALTRLDHEGLVRTIPRKGYQVKPMTIKSVDAMFDFWSIIGPEIARRGVAAASDAQINTAQKLVEAIQQVNDHDSAHPDSTQEGVRLCDALFELLAVATDNEYFVDAHRRTASELARVWTIVIDSQLLDTGRTLGPFDEAGKSIARRDSEAVAGLISRYIVESHHRVIRTLARWPSVVTSEVRPLKAARFAED